MVKKPRGQCPAPWDGGRDRPGRGGPAAPRSCGSRQPGCQLSPGTLLPAEKHDQQVPLEAPGHVGTGPGHHGVVFHLPRRQRRRSRACRAKQRGRSLSSLAKDLLLRVLAITSYSIPESIQSLKCCRCVVVGNGHRLRNSSLGDVINKYDMVIRLNNAPVAGYEGDVGSKTTMRLFYPESAHFNPKVENNPDTLLVLVAFKAMDFHWIETILSDKKRVRKGFWKQPPLIWDVNPKQIRILNPFFMEIAADKLLSLPMQQPRKMKQKPTTGLVAITLALHLCDVVHIAGFGYPDAHNRKQTIHYYEQITLKSMAGSGHNVSQEALAIKRMLGMGAVRNLTYF
ncbi:CMP-N-acetylneuraminate-beta-galactosamide-alpha-2,3-sialyltransferase 4 isoform 21-T23 [Molossus nigricans]